jgi:hypothetical protein
MSRTSRSSSRSGPPPGPEPRAGMEGRYLLIAGLLALVLFVVLYLTDVIPERVAGAVLAAVVVLGCAGLAAGSILSASRGPRGNAVALMFAAAVAAVAGVPVIGTLFPGEPAAQTTVRKEGESVAVPSVRGRVRVLAMVQPVATDEVYRCHAELGIGNQIEPLDLGRQPESVRMGRRGGRGTVMREHGSDWATGVLTDDAATVRLARLEGNASCAIDLKVYRDRLPMGLRIGLSALLLLAAALVAGFMHAGAMPAVATAMALAFALFAEEVITPRTAVRPGIGAILAGLPAGAAAGAIVAWICRAILPARPKR